MMLTSLAGLALVSLTAANEPAVPAPAELVLTPGIETAVGVVRTYDISRAMPRFGGPSAMAERLLPQIVIGTGGNLWRTGNIVEVARTESGEIVDLLISAMGSEAELEGRFIEHVSDTQVIVKGPEEFHARFAAVLAATEQIFASSARIQVEVFDFEAPPVLQMPSTRTLGAAEWKAKRDELIASGARRTASMLELEEGRTTSFHDSSTVNFIGGYDVEIAQASFAYDPLGAQARLGTRVFVQGSPRGGGLALALAISSSALEGELSERRLSSGGLLGSETAGTSHRTASLRVANPTISSSVFAAETFLPDGQVLLFAGAANVRSGRTAQVVAIHRLDSGSKRGGHIELPGTDQRFLVLPAGALAGPSLELISPRLWWSGTRSLVSDLPRYDNDGEGFGASVRFPASWEWLHAYAEYASDSAPETVWLFGPWLVAGGEDAALSKLLEVGSQSLQGDEALTVDLVLNDGTGKAPVTARLSVRTGGEAAAILGFERPAIIDFDVEVAQFAAVFDPTEALVFDGAAVRVTATRGADGSIQLAVSVRASLEQGEPGIERLQGFEELEVDRFQHAEFSADGRFVLPPNQRQGTFTLGGQPSDGTPGLTIQVR